ncbi:MAG TPA: hypothetical protein VJP86_10770 [Vicinamibacterales bacterium]|nr:hypothetical protein [Vicinamibacterales bacterium]
MKSAELEHAVDAALKRLPAPTAPSTLLPRVMAAVQAWAARPWYMRGWFSWPTAWQVTGLAALVLAASGVFAGIALAHAAASGVFSTFTSDAFGSAAATAAQAGTATEAARILWNVLVAPLIPYAFGLVMIMSLACGLLGAALNRAVVGRI